MHRILGKKGSNLDGGMKTVTKFFTAILILGVIGFTLIILLGNLGGTANDALPRLTGDQTVNETTTSVNETGVDLSLASTLNDILCTIDLIANQSGDVIIDSPNFTLSECTLTYSGGVAGVGVNNTLWNVTYGHTYKRSDAVDSLANLTAGTTTFFTNAGTWFTLLSIVIIIAIIVLVIVFVRKSTAGGNAEI